MSKIFESPDHGETVYVREEGSVKKVIHSESLKKKESYEQLIEKQLWDNIHKESEQNYTLKFAIERVKMLYYLTEDYEKKYGRRKT
jgi:hypothetical protein